MNHYPARRISAKLAQAFVQRSFLQKLHMPRSDAAKLIRIADWNTALTGILPLKQRLTCQQILTFSRPLLNDIATEPKEGWLAYTYRVAIELLYPASVQSHTVAQHDGAICFLAILQILFDEERLDLPFDPRFDFAFCTEEELKDTMLQEDYRQFLLRFREEYVYELMRLGREVTPYSTLEHIAGVHYVAMTVARTFAGAGGQIDLPLISGAAAGHDIGKFGCKDGERVPYLHYYYTDQWFSRRGLSSIGHIAANHSVWDLELENLSSESLTLVYADFRVKQRRSPEGRESTVIYSLTDSFHIILEKLDNVTSTKRRRYQFVYEKLRDFEDYLISYGVDTTLQGNDTPPLSRKNIALMRPDEVVKALRLMAVSHNIRLMHQLGHEELFTSILDAARSEKSQTHLQAYINIFEEYFTYWSGIQKEQTLEFLYELLMYPDGGIRRHSAALIGRILASFHSGYQKELPEDSVPDPEAERPFALWSEYLNRLIHPDTRLTPQQTSKIRFTAKLVVDSLLQYASDTDAPLFSAELFRHYQAPDEANYETAFALLDTVLNLPLNRCSDVDLATLISFARYWIVNGCLPQKAAALRLFRHILPVLIPSSPFHQEIEAAVEITDCEGSTPLLFLQLQLQRSMGIDVWEQYELLSRPEFISNIFLDNLKSATHWILKAVGVEYLLDQVEHGNHIHILHIATHFSNLIKVSENVVVRRMAGASLLAMASTLTSDRRNEIAVELTKSLETGQLEISRYIPEYLGRFALWLSPEELDEIISSLAEHLHSANNSVVVAALSTAGYILEYYTVYGMRFQEDEATLRARRDRLAGMLLKGLSSYREFVQQNALHILGEGLFASKVLPYEEKTELFTLLAKKILFLMNESREHELTFFYSAAALSHIYRFIVYYNIEDGPFTFPQVDKVAFFPGTFDPFSLSHKGIVEAIHDLGFEVYLAIDEFSWSKKTQPSLIRRQIASMSVADVFDVYLFPHDIPVNLANPEDLQRLHTVFSGRDVYLAVGSDVVANASSYKGPVTTGSVQTMNHLIFKRASAVDGQLIDADVSSITGNVITLQLPTHLEDISSTQIRNNIDLGRDISHLIDPAVQDFIHERSLYLREPQYKQVIRAGHLEFLVGSSADTKLMEELSAAMSEDRILKPVISPADELVVLRNTEPRSHVLGFISTRSICAADLFAILGDYEQTDYVRNHTAGRIQLITGIYTVHTPGGNYDVGELLLTEVLSRAMAADCAYALYCPLMHLENQKAIMLLKRMGFVLVPLSGPHSLLLVDMRSPAVLIQNISTTLKEPFASNRRVQEAVKKAHLKLQEAICGLYPGSLVLSVNASVIFHRLVRKIAHANDVSWEPVVPRKLGKKMCVPFGKILRGNIIPNTVTKTIHTDKVFEDHLKNFTIEAFPHYTPLPSQMRTIHSFHRPVILVDDLLHSGERIRALDPLFQQENVSIDRVIVGLLSGRGQDLATVKHYDVDYVYFIPNLRSWFVESTFYPFIGGDSVEHDTDSIPGLTPSVNLILPYAFPRFYKECNRQAVLEFSRTCIQNSRDIMLALEAEYRAEYSRNLTLSRLNEAVILPLSPDKGNCLRYPPNLAASTCLENDLTLLNRMQDLLK